LDSKARPKRATKPVIWPVLGRQSRQIVRAHCVKLGIPPCGGVPAIEHKEDAGACHLDFTLRRGAGPAASIALALAAAAEPSANATLSFAFAGEDGRGLLDVCGARCRRDRLGHWSSSLRKFPWASSTFRVQYRRTWVFVNSLTSTLALSLWNDTTLPATGFLGFLDPQKHSAATQPVQEAVAALPIESSQRMLTHRTVTKASTEPNQQPAQSPVVDH
jgi:hypothetical protein